MSQHPLRNDNVDLWWENLFKPGIKRLSINYCKKRICEQRSKRKLFQSQLEETVNSANFDFARYTELKRELLAWEREAMKGFAIRSRVESLAEEEATTFHINKSRSNFQRSLITKLETNENRTLTNPVQINKEIIEYFSKIFKNQPLPDDQLAENFLKGIRDVLNLPKSTTNGLNIALIAQSVSAQTNDGKELGSIPDVDGFLTAPFSVEEINIALKPTKKNKQTEAPTITGKSSDQINSENLTSEKNHRL
ncbi:hypothetical protein GHT06_006310 [Daphnia sinensis]|uniref:Uncharacterized protein n=1 Tax=Daphnia sinensis TaxID=1820382 RepID=A0AAD5PN47_9CRUS|nr:hypothetical protein GHT06_006310 [Daphnia sinensis]